MLTGFNTDVDYEGRTFHVQTRTRDSPIPSSRASSIRAGRSSGPAEQLRRHHGGVLRGGAPPPDGEPAPRRDPRDPERAVRSRGAEAVRLQHHHEPEPGRVVLDFLSGVGDSGRIRLEMEDLQALEEERPRRSGSASSPRIRIARRRRERRGQATVHEGAPEGVFTGTTAADGRVEATVEIPETGGTNAAILCQAEESGNNAELKQLVGKRRGGLSGV